MEMGWYSRSTYSQKGRSFLWSRGSKLISDSFPELIHAGESFNEDVVLDGEIVAFKMQLNLLSNYNDAWAENNLREYVKQGARMFYRL